MKSNLKFPRLFEPFQIGKLVIKNRIVMAPCLTRFSIDGHVNQQQIDYYVERANGGAGLIIPEAFYAYDSYRGFMQMYANVVLNISHDPFEHILDELPYLEQLHLQGIGEPLTNPYTRRDDRQSQVKPGAAGPAPGKLSGGGGRVPAVSG